jgi:hypothetical protein
MMGWVSCHPDHYGRPYELIQENLIFINPHTKKLSEAIYESFNPKKNLIKLIEK